jgi:hypothetical protein
MQHGYISDELILFRYTIEVLMYDKSLPWVGCQ